MSITQNQKILDTNILIRFLTDDNPKQAIRIKKLFQKSKPNELVIPDLVIAEIVYVLLSVYELNKEDVIEKISIIINTDIFDTNERLLTKTLEIFKKNNLSFVDAYLCALNFRKKDTVLYTFDKRMIKVNSHKIKQP